MLSDGVTVGREDWRDAGSNRRQAGMEPQGAAPDASVGARHAEALWRETKQRERAWTAGERLTLSDVAGRSRP